MKTSPQAISVHEEVRNTPELHDKRMYMPMQRQDIRGRAPQAQIEEVQ